MSRLTRASGVLASLADMLCRHIETTNPTHPDPPSSELASQAHTLNTSTTTLSTNAETGSTKIGEYVHEAGKTVGSYLPDSIAKAAEPVKEEDKSDFRKIAADSWSNLTIAAKGMANAGLTVGGALSESAHRAVEHNFGKEADKVAQGESRIVLDIESTTDWCLRSRSDRCESRLDRHGCKQRNERCHSGQQCRLGYHTRQPVEDSMSSLEGYPDRLSGRDVV